MSSLKNVKCFDELNVGQLKALVTKCGGIPRVREILRGDKAVTVIVEEIPFNLFDKHGRRIPPPAFEGTVSRPDFDGYYLVQPEKIDYLARIIQMEKYFNLQSNMSDDIFMERSQKLLEQLKQDDRLINLLNAVYLPICLPGIDGADFDYGKVLEEKFLPAVEWAYSDQFPDQKFQNLKNYNEGDLKGRVNIIPGSRHERLVVSLITASAAKKSVVGIYFPNSLQGFSVAAAREQMRTIPEGFFLAGGFDTCAAMVMYPDVLARDVATPTLHFGALSCDIVDLPFGFEATDSELKLIHEECGAYDFGSTGLLFVGNPE